MDNYTKTKTNSQSKVTATKSVDSGLQYMAETNERLNYIVETLKSHADMLKMHEDLLSRIRTRMGL